MRRATQRGHVVFLWGPWGSSEARLNAQLAQAQLLKPACPPLGSRALCHTGWEAPKTLILFLDGCFEIRRCCAP